MKGLLIKDIKLLKNQKQFFVVVLLIGILFLFTNENPSGAISYVMILSAMCAINTISYDEFENGMGFLFTLPISRRGYVKEKYVFAMSAVIIFAVIVTALSAINCIVRNIPYSIQEYGVVMVVDLFIAILIFSLQIPIKLKFRAEKSGIAMMAVFAFAGAIGFIIVKILQANGVEINALLEKMDTISIGKVGIVCLVLALTVICISYMISIRIIKNKEF